MCKYSYNFYKISMYVLCTGLVDPPYLTLLMFVLRFVLHLVHVK